MLKNQNKICKHTRPRYQNPNYYKKAGRVYTDCGNTTLNTSWKIIFINTVTAVDPELAQNWSSVEKK